MRQPFYGARVPGRHYVEERKRDPMIRPILIPISLLIAGCAADIGDPSKTDSIVCIVEGSPASQWLPCWSDGGEIPSDGTGCYGDQSACVEGQACWAGTFKTSGAMGTCAVRPPYAKSTCCHTDRALFLDGVAQTSGCACGECLPNPPTIPAC